MFFNAYNIEKKFDDTARKHSTKYFKDWKLDHDENFSKNEVNHFGGVSQSIVKQWKTLRKRGMSTWFVYEFFNILCGTVFLHQREMSNNATEERNAVTEAMGLVCVITT